VELQTDRLILRPHVLADFAELAAMWNDPVVTRHILRGARVTEGDIWSRLLRYVGHWTLQGYGFFAVRERTTGAFVGDVGFMDFRREMQPALVAPECGWVLAASAHGRGYATEAVSAVTAWADARFPLTTCIIDPDNTASIRVAAKCGFVAVRDAELAGDPVHVFERPRAG
jgi:RimJ/RimL family protein N-acetyltransferase